MYIYMEAGLREWLLSETLYAAYCITTYLKAGVDIPIINMIRVHAIYFIHRRARFYVFTATNRKQSAGGSSRE